VKRNMLQTREERRKHKWEGGGEGPRRHREHYMIRRNWGTDHQKRELGERKGEQARFAQRGGPWNNM